MNKIKLPPYTVSTGWVLKRILDLFLQPFGKVNCQQKIKPGTLSSSLESQTFTLGAFMFHWQNSASKSPSLSLAKNNQMIWSTAGGQNFIGGANITLKIAEDRGSVEIDEKYLAQFSTQTITKIQDNQGTLAN